MTRKLAQSLPRHWQQEETQQISTLLPIYKVAALNAAQPSAYPLHYTRLSPANNSTSQLEAAELCQNGNYKDQGNSIFSHRALVKRQNKLRAKATKRTLCSSNYNQKMVMVKQYNFGQIKQPESLQDWLKDKPYHQFIGLQGHLAQLQQKNAKDAKDKSSNSQAKTKSFARRQTNNRVNTQILPISRIKVYSLKKYERNHDQQAKSIEKRSGQRTSVYLNNQFFSKHIKQQTSQHSRNQNKLRRYLEKNPSQKPAQKSSQVSEVSRRKIFSSSLSNIKLQTIDQATDVMIRGDDRLKKMVRQYLNSLSLPFLKQLQILQSI